MAILGIRFGILEWCFIVVWVLGMLNISIELVRRWKAK